MSLVRRATEVAVAAWLCTDPASFIRYWRAGPVRVRPLGGVAIHIRPHTSDRDTLWVALAGGAHRPPFDAPRLIWDLGANIGVTMADLATRFPAAQIVGLELDPDNAALAETNLTRWPNCSLIRAAAWIEDGIVNFDRQPGREAGTHIAAGLNTANAISLNTLLERTGSPDFVKMDVEGAERDLLRHNAEWATEVRAINVECHGSYSASDCITDLEKLGFKAAAIRQPRWPPLRSRPTVIATRAGY